MSRISSVRRSRNMISAPSREICSAATLRTAYCVAHLADIFSRTLSNPIFCSKTIAPLPYLNEFSMARRSSVMLPIVWICPSETNEMSPVSSDTTMTEASETSDMPIAARWRMP